jgi:transketolase C-terminal domain/subunit
MLRLEENPCKGEKFHVVEKKETSCFEKGMTNLLRDGPTGTMVVEIGVGIRRLLGSRACLPRPLLYAEVVSVALRPRPRSALIHRLAR